MLIPDNYCVLCGKELHDNYDEDQFYADDWWHTNYNHLCASVHFYCMVKAKNDGSLNLHDVCDWCGCAVTDNLLTHLSCQEYAPGRKQRWCKRCCAVFYVPFLSEQKICPSAQGGCGKTYFDTCWGEYVDGVEIKED